MKVTKKLPLTVDRFESIRAAADAGGLGPLVDPVARRDRSQQLELKAVNPNAKSTEDTRTPEELLDIIRAKGREVDAAIAALRTMLSQD